jgi:hypothetical protein
VCDDMNASPDVTVVLVSDADTDGFGDTGSDAPKVNDDTFDVVNEDDKNDNKEILVEEKIMKATRF